MKLYMYPLVLHGLMSKIVETTSGCNAGEFRQRYHTTESYIIAMAVPSIVWLSVTEVELNNLHIVYASSLLTHLLPWLIHLLFFLTRLSHPCLPISASLSPQLTYPIPTLIPTLIPTRCLVSTHLSHPSSHPSSPISSSLSSSPAVSSPPAVLSLLTYIIPAHLFHPHSRPHLLCPLVYLIPACLPHPYSCPHPLSRLELNLDRQIQFVSGR